MYFSSKQKDLNSIPRSKVKSKVTGVGHVILIPALERQRQADFWVGGQPGLQIEFQDSQRYIEKPCLETTTTTPKEEVRLQKTKEPH